MTHDIVAAEVTLDNVHDAEVLPTLLNSLRRKLGHVYADGTYDCKSSHCSGQLNPDTWLGRSSAFAGGIPSLC